MPIDEAQPAVSLLSFHSYRWCSTGCESVCVPFLSMMFDLLWVIFVPFQSMIFDLLWVYCHLIPIDDVRPAVSLFSFHSYRWCSTCCGSIFVPFLSIMFDLLWVYFRSIPINNVRPAVGLFSFHSYHDGRLAVGLFSFHPIYDVRPAVSLSVFHSYQWCSTCRGSIFVPVLPYPLGPLKRCFQWETIHFACGCVRSK